MKKRTNKLAAVLILSGFSLSGGLSFAAEFEVMDRFSVDGYSVFRGSADIQGGSFTVGGSTLVVKDGRIGIGYGDPGTARLAVNGNVGIGTTSPGSKLTVGANPVGSAGALSIVGAAAGISAAFSDNTNSELYIKHLAGPGAILFDSDSGNYMKWGSNGSVKMTLDNNGNVGIGTAAPPEKLTVRGNIVKETSTGVDNAWDNVIKYGQYADLESGTAVANRWHGIDATITAGGAANNKLKLRLYAGGTGNAVPVDVMTLQGDGYVGIGTTGPAATLDVGGSGAIKIPVGTTAQRPTSPAAGMLRFNTDTLKLEYYNGTSWNISATGGNSVSDIGGYRIHTFTGNGTFTVTGAGNVEVLVVAGGGGGKAGGGGAGGLIYNAAYPVTAGAITVTVGAGGAANSPGNNSVFGTLTAIGGGRGGTNDTTGPEPAENGGSGGGGGRTSTVNPDYGGSGTAGQGFAGGNTNINTFPYPGSGGGGAGGAGNPPASATQGGAGGVGLAYSISGTSAYYAGGGGSGLADNGGGAGAGGLGGGGAGGSGGTAGTANTGGGGGGGSASGAAGGSGIVIVRYPF